MFSIFPPVTKSNELEETACLLAEPDFLVHRKLLVTLSPKNVNCDPALEKQIEKERNQSVKICYQISIIEKVGKVVMVEFQTWGNNLLASLLLVGNQKLAWKDYPAEKDEISCWRVDDGCENYKDTYKLLAAFDNGTFVELVLLWNAVEGQNFVFLQVNGQELMEITAFQDSRYWSPE